MTQPPAQILVLTPTARLARAEKRCLASARSEAGESAWRAPELLALPSWLGDMARQALLSGIIDRVPITSAQTRLLWQQVIDHDVFVGEPRVHALCERAWRKIHEYRLPQPHEWPELLLSEDSRRFRDWAAKFDGLCRARGVVDEWTFAAQLPEWITSGRFVLPERIELVGFERPPTPLFEAIFDALAEAGIDLRGRSQRLEPTLPATPELQQFIAPDDELAAAARWARSRLEADPKVSIGVVVPDLAGRLARVERVFRRVFDPPGFALEARTGATAAWHISMGPALADWPLVADALLLLRLDPGRIPQAEAGRLLKSPYLQLAEQEARSRAEAQAQLINKAPFEITAHELAAACSMRGALSLARKLKQWQQVRNSHRDRCWVSDWVGRFQTELEAFGFGHGRALNSTEWQVLERWHRLLEDFATLDVVQNAPIARGQALRLLAEQARSSSFRERNLGCPVEILGIEEALGSRFDALWITTLDSAHWPGAARRDPLIPGPIQAAIPCASGEGQLQQARLELAGLLRAGGELALSYACGNDSATLEPTPLLPVPDLRQATQTPQPPPDPLTLEVIANDSLAPAFGRLDSGGGIGVLRNQSACPFKAFAEHRLDAHALEPPRPGLSAAARGSLRHWALENFWQGLNGRAALLALPEDQLLQRIEAAAEQALGRLVQSWRRALSPAARRLEAASLQRMLQHWLRLERERGEFRVRALEQQIELAFAGLKLHGKIDRIDETEAGNLLIDYKTGAAKRADWKPDPRIVDPQLPAYALATQPSPAGIAFGRLKPDDLCFDGAARDEPGTSGVSVVGNGKGQWKVADDWSTLLAAWRENLEGLAQDFVNGKATVDPRKPEVCRYCQLQALCRIDERRTGIGIEENCA